jgi:GNAT superfamily N-acetyltransferase
MLEYKMSNGLDGVNGFDEVKELDGLDGAGESDSIDAGNLPDVVIRQATSDDIPQLLELYAQLNPEDRRVEVGEAAAVWDKAAGIGVVYFVADIRGRVVGTCFVAIIPNLTRSCKPICMIENVVTDEGYRRSGIGRRLLGAAIKYAKAQGCYRVSLQSGYKRKEAHKFYESIGFDGDSKRAFEIRF